MTVAQLREFLNEFNNDTEIKLRVEGDIILSLDEETILYTSEGAHVNDSYPEDEWDSEDGKIVHSGTRFLLINPIIT